MPQPLVQTQEQLDPICKAVANAAHIALDTEFIRQKTYRPQLCLIQLAYDDDIHCIDTLAITDLSPLIEVLSDVEIVIHSARQDIEALYLSTGQVLAPIFDTQIAAGLVGIGDQISYSGLVSELLGIELGKGETRTDWSRRPLSDAQLRYAQDDVRYLLQLYLPLRERLVDAGRLAWHEEECLGLSNPKLYAADPDSAWRHVKGTRALNPAQRRSMKRLAQWRERQADARDKPRRWILDDATLVDIALAEPQSESELMRLLNDRQRYLKRNADELLAAIRQAQHDPIEKAGPRPGDGERRLVKRGMELVRQAASEHGISPALLGTRKDVVQAVRGETSSLLERWRLELVGNRLLALIENQDS